MPVLTIARLTLFEAVRRRLVLAVIILTPIIIGCTGWGFSKLTDLKHSSGVPLSPSESTLNIAIFVILIAFMFGVVLAVGAIFLAAPAIASDIESGLILAIFPRPIRRSSVVLGKWLGLATLLTLYTSITAALDLLVIARVTGYSPPHPTMAVLFIIGQSLVLLSLTLASSTRLAPMASGVVIVALYGITWIVGIAAAVGASFHNSSIVTAGTIVNLLIPSDGLWRGAVYNLEPAVLRTAGLEFDPLAVTGPPTVAYMVWAIAWICAMIGCAIWSLNRRDL
jgi:ABC-type transport system involved in multi-copper enzyme maturation permease subunit